MTSIPSTANMARLTFDWRPYEQAQWLNKIGTEWREFPLAGPKAPSTVAKAGN